MLYEPKHRPLGRDEADQLAVACRTLREERVIWTLLDTGLRVKELACPTRDRIALREHCVAPGGLLPTVPEDGPRAFPVTRRIEPLIESWFNTHESFGLSVRSIQRIIRDVAACAGIERRVCAEVLRHTLAADAVRNGVSPQELQRMLGHKHPGASQVYFGPVGHGRSESNVRRAAGQ